MNKASNWLIALLVCLLVGLQFRLWVGDGSYAQRWQLNRQIQQQVQENERLQARNVFLAAEVQELKQGMETVEERARHELGMLKQGETLYLLME